MLLKLFFEALKKKLWENQHIQIYAKIIQFTFNNPAVKPQKRSIYGAHYLLTVPYSQQYNIQGVIELTK